MSAPAAPFQIVDAHQHFWDLDRNYYPWLRDKPTIPFRYGDYSAIRRNYMPLDYRKDADGYDVVGSVYVEAEWDPKDPVAEMAYIDILRRAGRLPTVAVAHARLDDPYVESILEQQAAFPFVRSIRHKPRANNSPNGGASGGMTDALWRRGYALLRRFGLRFDLQTPWWHLNEAAQLARTYPDTQIILNHTGLPADRSPQGIEGWKRAMTALAQCPNVAVKISGIGVPGKSWTADANRSIVLTVIDLFGAGRAMFASNFPVDSLCATFGEIFGGFREIVAGFSASDQRLLFRDNAIRIYAMEGA
ncbi:MAG TPA: amidohydrolase family protein [Pseudorhodoplanes sp.]|nr:amidohydrolase family protein [Pseudorhodoplanes sp.]